MLRVMSIVSASDQFGVLAAVLVEALNCTKYVQKHSAIPIASSSMLQRSTTAKPVLPLGGFCSRCRCVRLAPLPVKVCGSMIDGIVERGLSSEFVESASCAKSV